MSTTLNSPAGTAFDSIAMNPPPPFRTLHPPQPPLSHPRPSIPRGPQTLRPHPMPASVVPSALQAPLQQPQPHYELTSSAASANTSSSTTTGATHYSSASDLPTALSTLTSVLQLSLNTLNSLSSLLPTTAPAVSQHLAPCPFNPNHLLPPPSLFSHFLSCPSSHAPLSFHSLLHSLQYPHTLHSSPATLFTQPLENPNSSELCFSLENFLNFSNNFFYLNCPGPVIVNPPQNGTSYSPPLLTLPSVLSAECANFTSISGSTDVIGFSVESIGLLPSEIWAVGDEINGWDNYPASYSFRVLRAILRLQISNLLCLPTWVILNSPKYGVIIDLAMRDHIVLLFKLCLKAVFREAINSANLVFGREGQESGRDKSKFDCPVLVNVMRWLGVQLSILYGEVNGKFFAINMLKQCVFDSALNSSIFPLAEKAMESSEPAGLEGKLERCTGKGEENDRKITMDESLKHNLIFVSQVAAAVAALYERSWLELKINALRDMKVPTAYQRMVEYEHICKIADNDRRNRPDYIPVIEHDGLLSKQGQNQEPNRIKTREELLAEERDYKRRRTSYRGKKIKRTTTQVMRDIIDEYMEVIKQASNLTEEAEEVEVRAFESSSALDSSFDVVEPKRNQSAFGASKSHQHGFGENLHPRDHRPIYLGEKYLKDYNEHRQDSKQRHGHLENERSIKRARYDRKDYSRSPVGRQSSSHLRGPTSSREKQDDREMSKEVSSRSSDRSFSKSHRKRSHERDEYEHYWVSNRHAGKKHRDNQSSSSRTMFADRYNPAESDDT